MTKDFEPSLQLIFQAVLELDAGTDASEIRQLTFPRWDSLAHVSLISAIESEFGIEIDVNDQLELTSFAMMLEYLKENVR